MKSPILITPCAPFVPECVVDLAIGENGAFDSPCVLQPKNRTMFSLIRGGSLSAALLFVLLSPFALSPALAQDHSGHGNSARAVQEKADGDPYLLGTDAVSGKSLGPVDKQVIVVHDHRQFRFASQQNAEKFRTSPETYIPEIDAKLAALQAPFYPLETCLVSGAKLGKPDATLAFIHNNRLVRVANKEQQAVFMKDPAKYTAMLDAAVIEKQKGKYKLTTCPVSGEKLGSMGDPIDRVIGNRLVRLCCNGCLKSLEKDPLACLATLDDSGKAKAVKGAVEKAAGYVCPMHSDVVSDRAGRCPKCGMDLVKRK